VSDTNQSNSRHRTPGQQTKTAVATRRADHSEIAERGAAPGKSVPEPPKRSKKAKSQVVIFLNFLMTLIVSAVPLPSWSLLCDVHLSEPGSAEANTNFIVRNGAGITEIASNLERNNIISDGRVFRYLTATYLERWRKPEGRRIRDQGACLDEEIMELLKSGKSILYSVSLPRGPERQADVQPDERGSGSGRRPAGRPAGRGQPAPGYLQVLARHQARRDHRADGGSPKEAGRSDLGEARSVAADSSPEELVVLASIVEKETGVPTNARMSLRSSSIAWKRACGCSPIRRSSMVCSVVTASLPTGRSKSDLEEGHALQHLRDQGPAADADRQSRPRTRWKRFPIRGSTSGPLFRRRRHGRPCVCGHARRAQPMSSAGASWRLTRALKAEPHRPGIIGQPDQACG
jgi:hypothetical protein